MFDIHQKVFDEYGEQEEDQLDAYIDDLMEEFAASPEAKPLFDSGVGIGWTATMIQYGVTYCGATPATMSLRDFREVVFELFPRKVSTEPDSAADIVTELQAFWQFAQRQYGVANAPKILAELDGTATERLRKELADPANYGMAKSFVMRGMEAGYDMTTQQGADAFMHEYNRQLLEGRSAPLPSPFGRVEDWPALPLPNPPTRAQREDRRKARKRQRQARKRNRN